LGRDEERSLDCARDDAQRCWPEASGTTGER
jgi:hypothetical protein